MENKQQARQSRTTGGVCRAVRVGEQGKGVMRELSEEDIEVRETRTAPSALLSRAW